MTICCASTMVFANSDVSQINMIQAKYVTASSRGFLQGFVRGFYGNNTLNIHKYCMVNDSATNIENIYNGFEFSQLSDLPTFSLAIYNLMYSFNTYCPI